MQLLDSLIRSKFDKAEPMEQPTISEALEHLRAALAIFDAEGHHAAAALLDHLIHELQSSMAAASGAS